LAHECGHSAFSESKWINHGVGLLVHSLMLVPYHSWRFTHSQHHKATGHMTRDQVFIPTPFAKAQREGSIWEDTPLMNLYKVVTMVTLGWPFYLAFNVLSQPFPGQRANHFEPWSPLFKSDQRTEVFMSDVALLGVGVLLYSVCQAFGMSNFVFYYLLPYVSVNFWLVTITYLQHTHVDIPHYHSDDWTFIKGALATIDRDFGFLNIWFHHINDTHILHHLFSRIPHYHAEVRESAK
jgi:omega-6 fatty acid desaturase (delta-12 desaturase)